MVRALSQQDCLLLLDNCEHVLDGASALAEGLLARGEGVRVLATSREGLGVAGERMVAVRPLAAADAVRLFVPERLSTTAGSGAPDQGQKRRQSRMTRWCGKCASAWMGSHWRLSWPRLGPGRCRWPIWRRGWVKDSGC